MPTGVGSRTRTADAVAIAIVLVVVHRLAIARRMAIERKAIPIISKSGRVGI